MPNIETATPEEMKAWIDYLETKVERQQGRIEYLERFNTRLYASYSRLLNGPQDDA